MRTPRPSPRVSLRRAALIAFAALGTCALPPDEAPAPPSESSPPREAPPPDAAPADAVAPVAEPATPAPDAAPPLPPELAAAAAAFPGARTLLPDFAAPSADGVPRRGDALLLALELRDGRDVVRRLVLAEAVEATASSAPPGEGPASRPRERGHARFLRGGDAASDLGAPWITLRLATFDADGSPVGEGFATLPLRADVAGLRAALLALAAPGAAATPRLAVGYERVRGAEGTRREYRLAVDAGSPPVAADAGVALLALSEILRQAGPLRELRKALADRVVDAPSALTVLFDGGLEGALKIDARGTSDAVRRLGASDAAVPTARGAAVIELNRKRALDVALTAVDPRPPYHLTGGVLSATASRPGDPSRGLSLVVLGARRGP